MSINFKDDMNSEVLERMAEMFGEKLAIVDKRTALINEHAILGEQISELARIAKQPAALELHGEGEIKTMSDGTQYLVTPQGWKKINEAI